MTDLQQEVSQELRSQFVDTSNLDLDRCDRETLRQVLEAMCDYCLREHKHIGFTEEYSDLMSAISKKLGRKVWS